MTKLNTMKVTFPSRSANECFARMAVAAFAAIGAVDKKDCLLLGDSLTSDMQGGRNAGVDTCFLGKLKSDPRCDYIVEDLLDVLPLLGLHQAR